MAAVWRNARRGRRSQSIQPSSTTIVSAAVGLMLKAMAARPEAYEGGERWLASGEARMRSLVVAAQEGEQGEGDEQRDADLEVALAEHVDAVLGVESEEQDRGEGAGEEAVGGTAGFGGDGVGGYGLGREEVEAWRRWWRPSGGGRRGARRGRRGRRWP